MSPASLPGEGRASDRQQPEALKAGVAGDGLADAGPVDVLALLGDRLQQMVAHQAQQRAVGLPARSLSNARRRRNREPDAYQRPLLPKPPHDHTNWIRTLWT